MQCKMAGKDDTMSGKVFGIDFGTSSLKIYKKNDRELFQQLKVIQFLLLQENFLKKTEKELKDKRAKNFLKRT